MSIGIYLRCDCCGKLALEVASTRSPGGGWRDFCEACWLEARTSRILRACVAQRESEGLDRVPGQTELLCLELKAMRAAMYEARSHLGAIMIQTQPQDDAIIIGHVADALRILGGIAP